MIHHHSMISITGIWKNYQKYNYILQNVYRVYCGDTQVADTLLQRQVTMILDAATKCSVGIIVFVEGKTALQAATTIRRIAKEMGDATHAGLTIRLSPINPDQELWIICHGKEPEPEPLPISNELEIKF